MCGKFEGFPQKGTVEIELSKGSCWNFTPRGPEIGELCTVLDEELRMLTVWLYSLL